MPPDPIAEVRAAEPGAPQAPEPDRSPIVRFDEVSLSYGDRQALWEVSFELAAGSFTVLTGPSGAGKTSLLKLIYLAMHPTRGQVELFGRTVSRIRPRDRPMLRRRMGVVFQDFRLLEHMSVFDNAALPLRLAGARPSAYRNDVAELLAWVGLGDRMGALPSQLSGGEKQRLAIARAVVARPDLVVADEPTGNVDPVMSQRLLRLLLELNRIGATVLLATHDEVLVREAGAPVMRLEGGRIVAEAA